jgi:hypothetical protein
MGRDVCSSISAIGRALRPASKKTERFPLLIYHIGIGAQAGLKHGGTMSEPSQVRASRK